MRQLPLQLSDTTGVISDAILEKLYHDLKHGDHVQDDISLHNFHLYCETLYSPHISPLPGTFHDIGPMLALALAIGTNLEIGEHESGKLYARFSHWPAGDAPLVVMHHEHSIVIALAIVQNMRMDTGDQLNAGAGSTKH